MSKFDASRTYKVESSDGIEAEIVVKYYYGLSNPDEILADSVGELVNNIAKEKEDRSPSRGEFEERLERWRMLSDTEN